MGFLRGRIPGSICHEQIVYKEEKDGTIAIYRNKEKSTLTLITCTKNDNAKQTVYILERI